MRQTPQHGIAGRWIAAALLFTGAVVARIVPVATPAALFAQAPQPGGSELEVIQVRPNFYVIAGAGGNIAVQVGPIGAIVVDTGSRQMSDKVMAAVKRLTDGSVRYIIDTSADAEHTGGNEKMAKGRQDHPRQHGQRRFQRGRVHQRRRGERACARERAQEDERASRPRQGGRGACGRRRPMPAGAIRWRSTATPSRSCTCPPRIPTETASCSFTAPT